MRRLSSHDKVYEAMKADLHIARGTGRFVPLPQLRIAAQVLAGLPRTNPYVYIRKEYLEAEQTPAPHVPRHSLD
jgi:hypothetical protein